MDIEFTVQLADLKNAARRLSAAKPRGKQARAEFVDLTVTNGELQLVTTGASASVPAIINKDGYSRLPLSLFDRFTRILRTLTAEKIPVSIQSGQIKVANL